MVRFVAELVGTFFLVLTIACTVVGGGGGVIPPLAIGAALMVMVYAGGHISGGHYNPAVTLAVWMRGKHTGSDLIPFWIAQVAGAGLAVAAHGVLRPDATATEMTVATVPALLAELLFTFALAWVVLGSATAKATQGNSFYGLAIGMTVMTGAFAVGDISGGAFNPAVAVGISALGLSPWSNLWIYLVANFAGAALAAIVFRMTHPGED